MIVWLQHPVVVVGAGLAGLTAARHLTNLGVKVPSPSLFPYLYIKNRHLLAILVTFSLVSLLWSVLYQPVSHSTLTFSF